MQSQSADGGPKYHEKGGLEPLNLAPKQTLPVDAEGPRSTQNIGLPIGAVAEDEEVGRLIPFGEPQNEVETPRDGSRGDFEVPGPLRERPELAEKAPGVSHSLPPEYQERGHGDQSGMFSSGTSTSNSPSAEIPQDPRFFEVSPAIMQIMQNAMGLVDFVTGTGDRHSEPVMI